MSAKAIIKKLLRLHGYEFVRAVSTIEHLHALPDLTLEERDICRAVAPFTITSIERIVALIHATKYVTTNEIHGDIVECGVWRGGSMMVVAHVLQRLRDAARRLYLYDTFGGMPAPSARDVRFDGTPASQSIEPGGKHSPAGCYGDIRDVEANLRSTGYDEHRVRLIRGKVEDTIPQTVPDRISLVRLDTNWYESTKHSLTHLYPRLVSGGVLIIDDYGHWRGAKEAVDEYFCDRRPAPFLHRIDYTARLVIKL